MKLATTATILATALACFALVAEVAANDPIFVKWLVIDDPGDETIRAYWQRAEAGELGAGELVDLGTMLFYRGWPNDAVTYFRQALEIDPELSDAWFRIGLVKHHSGDLSGARSAYKKCLKLQSGHAWGNFYLALLEEQTGDATSAMKHYETAFKHSPALADPEINPEILSSRLQLGAQVSHFDSQRFQKIAPMPYMEPDVMRKVRSQFEPSPTPVPTPIPTIGPRVAPSSTPVAGQDEDARSTRSRSSGRATAGAAAGGAAGTGRSRSTTTTEQPDPSTTPYGFPTPPPGRGGAGGTGTTGTGDDDSSATPRIGDTSPEASLAPIWPLLYDLVEVVI
jgi:hypothetical protein